jgi:benzoyl-CoA reductase/2-hydroxyglutaryl-CoA dehydratase subunit BcrC/BadD/HgdB
VEIFSAAGLQPVRVSGKAETTAAAEACLCSNLCPYIKSVFTSAIEAADGKLDGVVFTRSCDGMRRMYDVWKEYVHPRFIYMLEVPKNNDEPAVRYFAAQLRDLAAALARAFNIDIKPAALKEAIVETGRSRKTMQDIYARQQASPLPVKGSDLFNLGLNSFNLDGGMRADELMDAYRRLQGHAASGTNGRKPRLLISGNVMDRPDLFHMVEKAGADVPAADLCTALRHYERRVDDNAADPYQALAKAYLSEPHCARTAGPAQRLDEIRQIIRDYSIDGVILTSVKFCDFQLYDAPYLMKNLSEAGTPVLFLENDYTFAGKDQMKVRVEAFIEMLEQGGK